MSYNSKYTGEQVEGFLDQIANGEISGGSSVYKWNWNSEMNGTFTEEEFENLSNADVVYITTGVADMEMLYSVDGRAVVEDALHLGAHILSFETDTDNSKAAYVESITFIFDNASKTWNAQGGDAELITNEQLTSALEDKQDKITDLDAIRSGAEKGATALQSVPSEYVTESELTNKGYATTSALNNKVDKVSGKQLSTEDFTSALKSKLEGLSNYDDTELSNALSTLRGDFDKLVSGDTTTAIKTFNEVIAFLDGIQDSQDLSSIIASIEQQIAAKQDKIADLETIRNGAAKGATALQSYTEKYTGTITGITMNGASKGTSGVVNLGKIITEHQDISGKADKSSLATVATSGSYNDLSNKPTIPSAVTESTVSGWGFTKNTGTYSKPSGGIPKTDLASAVQTSLGKADTALQSYTEQYKGTVTGVKINGTTKNPSSGVVDLGTVITSHQDISGKQDKLVSGTNIKTINGESILGEGNITIEGGSGEGGGDSSVFITHFTIFEFINGSVEFTDEQVEAIRDAAKQNKIIALPHVVNNMYSGFVVSSYNYHEDFSTGELYWYFILTVTYDNITYNNEININNTSFSAMLLTVTPAKALVESVGVNEDGYVIVDSYGKDNLIVIVEGECRLLQIGEVGFEYGMTVRFFTGEDCTIEYWGNWANGVIPTIEPYTAYEMSIVWGADYNPCAVLTPFKYAE